MVDKKKVEAAIPSIAAVLAAFDLNNMEKLMVISEAMRYELKAIDMMCEIVEKDDDAKADAINKFLDDVFEKLSAESGD